MTTRLLVLGIVQNVAKEFYISQFYISKLLDHFPQSQCVIYQNDSSDETRPILDHFAKERSDVQVFHDHLDVKAHQPLTAITENGHMTRIQKIAIARNALLKYTIDNKLMQKATHVIWIDMDGHRFEPLDVQKALDKFEKFDCDVLACNDIHPTPDGSYRESQGAHYYDRLALREPQVTPFGPELNPKFWGGDDIPLYLGKYDCIFGSWHVPRDQDLYKVYCAFGGLAIYKPQMFLEGHKYDYKVNDDVKQWYDKIYMDTQQQSPKPGELKYIQNSGFKGDSVIVCEHICLAAALDTHGYSRYFIDPELMFYRYQPHLEKVPQFDVPKPYYDDYQKLRNKMQRQYKLAGRTADGSLDTWLIVVISVLAAVMLIALFYMFYRRRRSNVPAKVSRRPGFFSTSSISP